MNEDKENNATNSQTFCFVADAFPNNSLIQNMYKNAASQIYIRNISSFCSNFTGAGILRNAVAYYQLKTVNPF